MVRTDELGEHSIAANLTACRLEPHATPDTDVILLGHSMGGLLTAETVLLPSPVQSPTPILNKILGTVSFDTPYLGMDPGIIKAGLGSIFRSDETPLQGAGGSDGTGPLDPNYNPPFFNDVKLPVRSAWRNAAHFVNKHSNNLTAATKKAVSSHVDFGRCLADYEGLRARYCRIRMLEDDDQSRRNTVLRGIRQAPRVRFINYYTASTGRPKRPKSPNDSTSELAVTTSEIGPTTSGQTTSTRHSSASAHPASGISRSEKAPVLAVEDSDEDTVISDLGDLDDGDDLESHFDDPISSNRGVNDAAPAYNAAKIVTPIPRKNLPAFTEANLSRLRDAEPGSSPRLESAQNTQSTFDDFDPQQPGLPLEPSEPGPPPSAQQFKDLENYRAELHEHGTASKAYFKEAKEHQAALWNKFQEESQARSAAYSAEITRQSGLLSQEAVRFGEAAGENARINAEIANEEIKSVIEHRKLVAEYRKLNTVGPSKAQERLDKVDKKLREKQAKIENKAREDREKLLRKTAKRQQKLTKAGRTGSSETPTETSVESPSVGDGTESMTSHDTFFDATKEFVGAGSVSSKTSATNTEKLFAAADTDGYDMQTAPIGKSISTFRADQSSKGGANSANGVPNFNPDASPSQVSLDTLNTSTPTMVTDAPTILTPASSVPSRASQELESGRSTPKPKKDKKFCNLPPKDASGSHDPTWVRVYMEDVDEVGAHCGLFFSNAPTDGPPTAQGWSERYARLVSDVGERIEQWVSEDMTRRLVEGFGEDVD